MSTRYNSSGRIQPIEYRNLARPGECLLCKRIGRSPDEIFANIGVELDFYGDCYLCQDCCHEFASFVMAVPEDTHRKLVDEYVALQAINVGLVKKIEYLRGLLDARINSAGSSKSDSDEPSGVPVFETEPDTGFIDSILEPNKSVSS